MRQQSAAQYDLEINKYIELAATATQNTISNKESYKQMHCRVE